MNQISVLYLEDSSADADLTARALARNAPHMALDHFSTLGAALQALGSGKVYDLALIDLALPDGSGLDLLAMLRENKLRTAVVILTGSGNQSAVITALKAGADDYIVKRDDYLQRLPQTLEAALQRYREVARQRGQALQVLYVEHNRFDVDLLRRHLAIFAPHIRLTVAQDADAALHLLSTRSFDVVLADYLLPGADGLELARRLKQDASAVSRTPFVLLTGQGSEEVAAAALHLGVDDYLNKHEGYLHEISVLLDKVHRDAQLERQRVELQVANERLAQLIDAAPCVLYELALEQGQQLFLAWVSDNIQRMSGFTVEEALAPDWWANGVHPDDREKIRGNLDSLLKNGYLVQEYRFKRCDGQWIWIRDEQRLVSAETTQPVLISGVWLDITTDKLQTAVAEARNQLLDQLLERRPIEDILSTLARQLESLVSGAMASVLVIDPMTTLFRTAAAPSLPGFFSDAVNQLKPAMGQGNCGTAAASGKPVITVDIERAPDWKPYIEIARRANLRACWSVPFSDDQGKVLGTLAIYKSTQSRPTDQELCQLVEFSRLAALAVTKGRDQQQLDRAAAVFDATRDGIIITDTSSAILAVNRAFTEVTGYKADEALGNNPSMLQSGRHKRDFYQAMWRYIEETGHWQGEVWNRRKNGEIYPQWLTISTIFDKRSAPTNYVAVFTDISNIKASEAQLEHLAHYDPLTDLPNRLLSHSRLQKAVEMAARHQTTVAVLFMDLDHFKNINDSLGHPAGDELLVEVARRLSSRLRSEDTLARLGGDEFLVILNAVESAQHAAVVAQSLLDQMNQAFSLQDDNEVFAGLSIGISLLPDDASDATELIQHADAAMYLAKQQGRNTYRFHTESLTRQASERLSLQTQLRFAIERNQLDLHYQPLVNSANGRTEGAEVLARWHPEGHAPIPPDRFIPVAEDSGLIMQLGEWVIHTACQQGRQWLDEGLSLTTLAVNVSSRQFSHGRLVDLVRSALDKSGFPAEYLELELTESMLMQQPDKAIATLTELKSLGVRLAIDDFGTGYSSLAYLKRFPIDTLKIDKSFIDGLPDEDTDREITATIVAIAKTLRMSLVAEGVETPAQRDCLGTMGCDIYQGYLYSRPLPPEAFAEWFRSQS